jgi:hypothetical protein
VTHLAQDLAEVVRIVMFCLGIPDLETLRAARPLLAQDPAT